MEKKKVERLVLMVLLVVLVLIAGYFGVFEGQYKKWLKIRRNSEVLEKDLENAQSLKDGLPRARKQSETFTAQLSEMDKNIIAGGEFSEFVAAIKNAADKAGLKLQNVRPVMGKTDIPRGPDYVERWIRVEVIARYHIIGQALAHLEDEAPSVRVVEFKLHSSQDETGVHPAQFTLGFIVKPEK
jgi:Tfp pilus assembly protein PilO